MTSIRLPRLLDASLKPLGLLNPTSLSISLKLSSLSTASMNLPTDTNIQVGQFVELFTQQGSAGIFRVEQLERSCQQSLRVSLSHSLITLSDSLFLVEDENTVTLPAQQLFQDILSRQSGWTPGQIDLPQGQLVTWQGRSCSLLEALLALLAALPTHCLTYDQSVFPWVVSLVPLPQDGLSECRLTRNLRSLTIETDRSELCTQLYLPGVAQPLQADTMAQWGVVARCMDADGDLSQEELLHRGQQYLEQHKNPAVTIQMEALELSHITGCALDSFRLGAPCRVCLPEEHTSLTHRIVCITWPDVYATPQLLSITLANKAQSASSLLAGLIVDTTQVKHQVNRQWNALGDQKKLLIAADESIDMISRTIDLHAEAINLRASQTDVDALTGRVTNAEASIQVNANGITSKVSKNGVISAINQTAESVRISASRINLDGYVTMSSMEAEFAELRDGFAMEFSTTDLHASTIALGQSLTAPEGYVSANTLMAAASITVDGHEVATQDWVASAYIPKANLSTLATQMWVGTNYATKAALDGYQPKDGLTTKTITVVKGISRTTATTPPFYNESGVKINNGIEYVKSVTYETETLTVVVFTEGV